MKQKASVIDCYDKSANAYAEQFMQELEGKSLDRLLLRRFAEDNGHKGLMLDLACGPGHTTLFLRNQGVENLLGLDISPQMVEVAHDWHKGKIAFAEADMLALPFRNDHAASAICFYGIVHFTYEELDQALKEIRRVLQAGGQFLFSFHIGEGLEHVSEFLGQEVEIDFQYFEVERVREIALAAGWEIKEVVERHPYEGVEYPSRRGYFLLQKPLLN
ncbi:MAG: class I SAM-dependent methyltransferase [Bacteroidota bacterium]